MFGRRRRQIPRTDAPTDGPGEVRSTVDDAAAVTALVAGLDTRGIRAPAALREAVDRCSADTLLELFAGNREWTHRTHLLRAEIAETFGRLGDRRAVAPLLAAYREMSTQEHLSDSGHAIATSFGLARGAIATSLGRLGGPEVVDVMLAQLAMGDRTAVRVLVACGGDDRVVPALIECLRQRGWSSAAAALGELGDRRAVPVICAMLEPINQGMDSGVHSHQVALAGALAGIGDAAALPALRAVDPGAVARRTMDTARDADDGPWLAYLHSCQAIHDAVATLKRGPRRRRARG
jgi:HEAT repeat protein